MRRGAGRRDEAERHGPEGGGDRRRRVKSAAGSVGSGAPADIAPERYGAGPKARPVITAMLSRACYFVQVCDISTVCELSIVRRTDVV